jgi:Transcription initiation factor IIA, gamma subunit, helical domain
MARRSKKQRKSKQPGVHLKLPWHELMPSGNISIGASLMDTIDDLINEGHIEPQLAMKILGNFDKIVQEVLADKVKARLTFKVCLHLVAYLQEPGK